jgi:hypothetical protein
MLLHTNSKQENKGSFEFINITIVLPHFHIVINFPITAPSAPYPFIILAA